MPGSSGNTYDTSIFPDDRVDLDVSFRSTNRILSVSHDCIMHNYPEDDAGLCVRIRNFEGAEGENVNIAECMDEDEEARYIVEQIEAYLASGLFTLNLVKKATGTKNMRENGCSIFLLAGTEAATPTPSGGSGGSGTYPPGWFETPTPAMTATKASAPSATATATDAPPGERVTPAPTKRPAAATATAPAAEGTTARAAKQGLPGFTAVFVIAGMLAGCVCGDAAAEIRAVRDCRHVCITLCRGQVRPHPGRSVQSVVVRCGCEVW